MVDQIASVDEKIETFLSELQNEADQSVPHGPGGELDYNEHDLDLAYIRVLEREMRLRMRLNYGLLQDVALRED